jgi:hypothetical protein
VFAASDEYKNRQRMGIKLEEAARAPSTLDFSNRTREVSRFLD